MIGVSAGAVVGAVYAAGGDLGAVRDTFDNALDVLLSWNPELMYPLDRSLIEDELEGLIGEGCFDDLSVDFRIMYFDVPADEEVVVSDGVVKDAVIRSMAVPGMMDGVNDSVIEGGFWSPLPLHCAAEDSSYLIACDVSPPLSLVEDDSFRAVAKNVYALGHEPRPGHV